VNILLNPSNIRFKNNGINKCHLYLFTNSIMVENRENYIHLDQNINLVLMVHASLNLGAIVILKNHFEGEEIVGNIKKMHWILPNEIGLTPRCRAIIKKIEHTSNIDDFDKWQEVVSKW